MSIRTSTAAPTSASFSLFRAFDKITFALPAATAICLIALWQVVTTGFGVPTYIVPGPIVVVEAIITNWNLILWNLAPTVVVALSGFVLGSAVGIVLAIILVYNAYIERSFFPIIVFIYTIPLLALAPILMLIFGQGYVTKILISAFVVFFPTMVNMVRGLKSVNKSAIELMHVLSASKPEVFIKLRIPKSIPYLFAALKIGSQACVTGALVSEWIGSNVGVGSLILECALNYRGPLLFGAIIVAASLAVLILGAVAAVEKPLVRWTTSDAH